MFLIAVEPGSTVQYWSLWKKHSGHWFSLLDKIFQQLHVVVLYFSLCPKRFVHHFSGISDSYQMGIFRILAGILHLGNVEFASRDSDSCVIPVSSRWAEGCRFYSDTSAFSLVAGTSSERGPIKNTSNVFISNLLPFSQFFLRMDSAFLSLEALDSAHCITAVAALILFQNCDWSVLEKTG